MVQTREQKVRLRYRKDLADGKTPDVRTEANMIILDEVRKEIEQEAAKGKKSIQSAASAGTARVKRAADAGAKLVEDVVKEGERRLKRTARECNRQLKRLRTSIEAEEALPTADQEAPPVEAQPAGTTPEHPAGQDLPTASQPASLPDRASGAPSDTSPEKPEAPADETGVAPTAEASGSCAADEDEEGAVEEAEEDEEMDAQEPDEEARARDEEEKREQALREQARREEQKEQQARRAAQRIAVLKNLPAPIDKMPPWFIQNVQRYYDFDFKFYEALRKKKQEALQAVQDQMAPGRAAGRECRRTRRQWEYRYCEEHVARLDPAVEARINDELRAEYEGEAAMAAFRYKEDDEKRARAERQAWDDKQAAARSKAAAREDALREARLQLTPGCKACADCTEADFALGGICSRHEVELEALAAGLMAGAAATRGQARASIEEAAARV